ncbi:MAG: flagellar basal body-associated FliL family protein [Litorivicinus sp.]
MPWLLLLLFWIGPATAEDVFDATDLYVDLVDPFYSSYEKSRTQIGVAMIAMVTLEVADATARDQVMAHRPLLRDSFQRLLSQQSRATFISTQGWLTLAEQATDQFNETLAREGCTNCVRSVLFPAGIIPEG